MMVVLSCLPILRVIVASKFILGTASIMQPYVKSTKKFPANNFSLNKAADTPTT